MTMKNFLMLSFAMVFVAIALPCQAATFTDDFNDGNANGWWLGGSPYGQGPGSWRVENGELVQGPGGDSVAALVENIQASTQTIEAKVNVPGFGYGGITFWYKDAENWASVMISNGNLDLAERINGVWTNDSHIFADGIILPIYSTFDIWHDLKVETNSDTGEVKGYIDGHLIFTQALTTLTRSGQSGVINGNAGSYFDDFSLIYDEPVTENQSLAICDHNGDGVRNLSDIAIFAGCKDTFDANNDGIHNLEDISLYASMNQDDNFCASTFRCVVEPIIQRLAICDHNGDGSRDLADIGIFASCKDTFDANGDGIHDLADISLYASMNQDNNFCSSIFRCVADQPIIPECTASDWNCTDWSTCQSDNTQARSCTKAITCEGGVTQPAIIKSCRFGAATILSENFDNTDGYIIGGGFSQYWDIAPLAGISSIPSYYTQGGGQFGDIFYGSFGKGSSSDPAPTMTINLPDLSNYTDIQMSVALAAPDCTEITCWEITHRDSLVILGDSTVIDSFLPISGASALRSAVSFRDLHYMFSDYDYAIGNYLHSLTFRFASTAFDETIGIDSVRITGVPICTQDEWTCSDWGSCQIGGSQIRTCTKTFDCPLAETPSPLISQSCIYTPPQLTKDGCKNNGWKLWLNPIFKNQGQCVSYVEGNAKAGKINLINLKQ